MAGPIPAPVAQGSNHHRTEANVSRGDDKQHKGNHGQHKATGKAGAERLESQRAMERIRQGQDNADRASRDATTQDR
jgi:hypothetical protein